MRSILRIFLPLLLLCVCLTAVSCAVEEGCRHTYGEPEAVMPTCTEAGVYVYTCTLCGEQKRVAPQPGDLAMRQTSHRESFMPTQTVEPTCLQDGYEQYSCVDCHEPLRQVSLMGGEHLTVGAEYIHENGSHYCLCTRCGERVDEASCSYTPVAVDDEKHIDTCPLCHTVRPGAEPVAHRFTSEREHLGTGDCAVGKICSVCADCGGEKIKEKFSSDVAHKFVLDREETELTAQVHEHTGASHPAAYGWVVYRCTVCDERLPIYALSARTFDDGCPCGSVYADVTSSSAQGFVLKDGILSFRGAVNRANYGSNVHILSKIKETAVSDLKDPMRMVLSLDFKPAEAGLPEAGVKLSMKVGGSWTHGGMIHMYDTGIYIGDNRVAPMSTEWTNFMLSLTVRAGILSYDVYVNGVYVGSGTKTSNTTALDAETSYAHLIIPYSDDNINDERGYDVDNILMCDELPELLRAAEGDPSDAPKQPVSKDDDFYLDEDGSVHLPPISFQ